MMAAANRFAWAEEQHWDQPPSPWPSPYTKTRLNEKSIKTENGVLHWRRMVASRYHIERNTLFRSVSLNKVVQVHTTSYEEKTHTHLITNLKRIFSFLFDCQMTLILVLIFFKSVCLYLQNIVLCCYDKFLNPRRKYLHHSISSSSSSSSASSNLPLSPWSWFTSSSARGNRTSLLASSGSALSKARAIEREQLLEQIRARKRTKARSKAY